MQKSKIILLLSIDFFSVGSLTVQSIFYRYIYMLKPKDDLRKDFRLMEFNDIVNQLLARDGEARQRRLSIRLYSVAPLNEECGLIEWVPNLVGLRPVLMNLYKQRGEDIYYLRKKQKILFYYFLRTGNERQGT